MVKAAAICGTEATSDLSESVTVPGLNELKYAPVGQCGMWADETFVEQLADALGPGSASARALAELKQRRDVGEDVALIASVPVRVVLREGAEPNDLNSPTRLTHAKPFR